MQVEVSLARFDPYDFGMKGLAGYSLRFQSKAIENWISGSETGDLKGSLAFVSRGDYHCQPARGP